MSTCQEVRQNIKRMNQYVNSFPFIQKSPAVELLFSKSIAYMLHLPFYNSENNNPRIKQKVVWNGRNEAAPEGAPNGGADTVV